VIAHAVRVKSSLVLPAYCRGLSLPSLPIGLKIRALPQKIADYGINIGQM
jgi:hypothetical protein